VPSARDGLVEREVAEQLAPPALARTSVQRIESEDRELAGAGLDTCVQRHIDPGTDPECRREPAVLPGLASFSPRWAGERMSVISCGTRCSMTSPPSESCKSAAHYTSQPPSTVIDCPVMFDDSSEARNSARAGDVAGHGHAAERHLVDVLLIHLLRRPPALFGLLAAQLVHAVARHDPGCSAFTLTLWGPASSATVRVGPRSAHFDDEYAVRYL
jgi:hypothetical protein